MRARAGEDVDLRPVTPFYRIRFDDGAVFDYSGDPEAMRAEVARFAPADVAGYERFMAMSEAIFRDRLRAAGPRAVQLAGPTWRGSCPSWSGCRAYRSVYGLVAATSATRGCGSCSASIRCWSAATRSRATSIYCLIAFLRAASGACISPWAAPAALVRGLVGLIEGQGGEVRCDARGGRDHGRAAAGRPACGWPRARTIAADDRGLQRRFAPGPTAICVPAARAAALDRPPDRARALLDEPVRLVFRHQAAVSRTWRTTRSCSGRATASCSTTSSSARCWPTISASICTARPPPIPRWRRRAAMRSTCCRRCRNLDSGTDWRAQAEPYRQRIARHLAATRAARPRGRDRHLAHADAAGLPGPAARRSAAPAFGLEPVLTQSAWFRPHNRSEEVAGLYLVGAGTHPGAGLPGVLSSARVLDAVVPDAWPGLSRATLTPPTSPPARSCCAHGSKTFFAASLPAAAAPARARPRCSTPSAGSPTMRRSSTAAGRSRRPSLRAAPGARL